MFYDNLKAICDEKGLKVTPIVAECGGAKGSISNWKKGAMPNSEIVMKLSVRLNVSSDRLLFGSSEFDTVNLKNSAVGAIGNHSTGTVSITHDTSDKEKPSSDDEMVKEIARILNGLSLKERSKLLTMIYDFEEKCNPKSEK
ncbi:MAG: helix-turn-helix transcriptional regulator [Ruminococcus sp.]